MDENENPVENPTDPEIEVQRDQQNVHLPGVFSDEFGISQPVARTQLMMGKLTVDGEPWTDDPIDIPRDRLAGKTIELEGDMRSFRFTHPE